MSDVSVESSRLRRIVLFHSLISLAQRQKDGGLGAGASLPRPGFYNGIVIGL